MITTILLCSPSYITHQVDVFANSQQLFYTYVNQINQYQCKKNLVQQISNRLSIS